MGSELFGTNGCGCEVWTHVDYGGVTISFCKKHHRTGDRAAGDAHGVPRRRYNDSERDTYSVYWLCRKHGRICQVGNGYDEAHLLEDHMKAHGCPNQFVRSFAATANTVTLKQLLEGVD